MPLRRLGTVDDIGAACVLLASDEARWITGETIQITGGSRITVGHVTYMYRVAQELAGREEGDVEAGSGPSTASTRRSSRGGRRTW